MLHSLKDNNITSKGASILFDYLKQTSSTISAVNLSGNKIDDACMTSLGEYIQSNQYIMHVYICYNKVTDKGIEILSEYILGNITLKQLNLNCLLGVTDASTPFLIDIAKMSYITSIGLNNTLISFEKQQEKSQPNLLVYQLPKNHCLFLY